ncbi:MAG: L,D-transpeptidase family protein [Nitrospirota bacterium]
MVKRILLTLHVIISVLFLNSFFLLPVEVSALAKADKVVVIKSKRILMLLRDGEIWKTYKIALGKQPAGHKIFAGDKRTPEGNYFLDRRNMESRFHLSIHISYPNESDIFYARKLGVSPGGDIMIHGLPAKLEGIGKFHRIRDWTDGCIAVTNSEIEEMWQLVPDGTPIEIRP